MNTELLTVESLERAATMLKAIAHPARIAILSLLDDGSQLTVSEIHNRLSADQATTSHHLGLMRDKGILSVKRDGKHAYYFLKNNNLKYIVECISKCTGCDEDIITEKE